MKKIFVFLSQLPIWYSMGIIGVYSILLAEYTVTICKALPYNILGTFFETVLQISYVLAFIAGFITWIISAFLFHITALLYGGRSSFNKMLYISSYAYIVLIIGLIINISIITDIHSINPTEVSSNSSFILVTNIMKFFYILFYSIITVMIYYCHQIKYVYAALSVIIPTTSTWLITELIKIM